MHFNPQKFQYMCCHTKPSANINNVYLSPSFDIINPSSDVKDLGIVMANSCSFNLHIEKVIATGNRVTGWILRTFSCRSKVLMMTLFKSVVLPLLEYACQLWSPNLALQINALERIQRSFTKQITNLYDLSYEARLKDLNLYSLQRRRDRYRIIYIWKIIEQKSSNLVPPISTYKSSRHGRFCVRSVVPTGHNGTLLYNSFRFDAIRLFNSLPTVIRNITSVDVAIFKHKLDQFLLTLRDAPGATFSDNCLINRIQGISHNI